MYKFSVNWKFGKHFNVCQYFDSLPHCLYACHNRSLFTALIWTGFACFQNLEKLSRKHESGQIHKAFIITACGKFLLHASIENLYLDCVSNVCGTILYWEFLSSSSWLIPPLATMSSALLQFLWVACGCQWTTVSQRGTPVAVAIGSCCDRQLLRSAASVSQDCGEMWKLAMSRLMTSL